MLKYILTWDLGATKCAAAVVSFDTATKELRCENACAILLETVDSLEMLVSAIEQKLAIGHRDVDSICIGAAGFFDGNTVYLERGYPFPMTVTSIAKSKNWPQYAVVHDYTPVICASFYPGLKTLEIARGNQSPFERRVAFGVGTGLGLKDGVLSDNGDFWLGTNEMGHIGLCSAKEVPPHMASFHQELCQHGLTFEDILSGRGMLRLHRYLKDECC